MSYPQLDTDEDLLNLLRRKEFHMLKGTPDYNFRDPPNALVDPILNKYLKIHSHQLFVKNLMNPNTQYKRLHLMHATGSGKTLAAVSIAQEFIKVNKKIYNVLLNQHAATRQRYIDLDKKSPSIFVLGFGGTKAAFVRELLKYTEFGFITISEKDELVKRQKNASTGLVDDVKNFKDYYTRIKKRITNKSKGGFYKFYGYDEFVNRLFITETVKLTELETEVLKRIKTGESVTLEDVIRENITNGTIVVNKQLLSMFTNSLLICDEVHNTYNMHMKNNRGVAIQYLLNSIPTLRLLSLSATPINNSPSEVVDLLNYLVPQDKKLVKREFFNGARIISTEKLHELGQLSSGYISFLQDISPKYFPERILEGQTIQYESEDGRVVDVPYLKFTPCKMSAFHQRTWTVYTESDNTIENDEEEGEIGAAIPIDGYSIYDISFPNPDSSEYGLFRSSDIRNKIPLASQEWRDANMVSIKKTDNNTIISGDILLQSNIAKYSAKYSELIKLLSDIMGVFKGQMCQKIMIFHDRIKTSGVLLIQEILYMNGFIGETSEPVESTLCSLCGKRLYEHNNLLGDITSHTFAPARFIHTDADKAVLEQSLAKYDSLDNINGVNYIILIGGPKVKESYDFKCIQHLIILSMPTSIPTLIQVFGRCIRKGSHLSLPPDKRKVHVHVLVTVVDPDYPSPSKVSPELRRYIDKLEDYKVIQTIERELNRRAIDSTIHRDIIMPQHMKDKYFPQQGQQEPTSILGNLYFDPSIKLPKYTLGDLTLSTFNAYRHYEDEIRLITYIIKRLFILLPVWVYSDLWDAVRKPPFGIEVNPAFFIENNFIIALNNLTSAVTNIMSYANIAEESLLVERMFDYAERYIYVKGVKCKIQQVHDYYILFPVYNIPENPLNKVFSDTYEVARDKERIMMKQLIEPNNHIIADVETYINYPQIHKGAIINIDNYLKLSSIDITYTARRQQFLEKYINADNIQNFIIDYSSAFQTTFLEEVIAHMICHSLGFVEQSRYAKLYNNIIKQLADFNVIIFSRELSKYKDTVRQYKFGMPSVPDNIPLGYMSTKTIKLYDPLVNKDGVYIAGKWLEINKIALNRQISYKENEIIIGHLESLGDEMKFKLRRPIQHIRDTIHKDIQSRKQSQIQSNSKGTRTLVNDTRLIERGIVCSTKKKHELLTILASLGISPSKIPPADIRLRKLCNILLQRLIDSEIRERQKDSLYKYLYSWWDDTVNIASYL
jgi:hypothetical protein